MKAVLSLPILLAFAAPAGAFEINSRFSDSVQLTVNGPAVETTRLGGSYAVSGSNISATSFGGATAGAGTYDINTSGQDFTFSETYNAADSVSTSQSSLSTNGRFDSPTLYGHSITAVGGSVGDLAGSLSATGGAPTVTAGGVGTSAVAQTAVELSVFK